MTVLIAAFATTVSVDAQPLPLHRESLANSNSVVSMSGQSTPMSGISAIGESGTTSWPGWAVDCALATFANAIDASITRARTGERHSEQANMLTCLAAGQIGRQ